ncbi:MAG: hypothetical protein GDA39_07335 [Hyphomonadaceae bacterium]|nr:hypothetical protein [Hyphomonadaceae bacterium]MBC6412690.1 hypothetical protein [Hyphomonadaceae bacterium]
MNTVPKKEPKENRFRKVLDDAGRSLRGTGDYRFLGDIPKVSHRSKPCVPFPYGFRPQDKTGWE